MTSSSTRGGSRLGRRTLLIGVPAVALLAACGGDGSAKDDPRPLSEEEAQLLAVTRFRLHERGTVPVTMTWPSEPVTTIDATIDFESGLAIGTSTSNDAATEPVERYIGWTASGVATAPREGGAVPGPDQWVARALQSNVPQDLFLGLVLSLGADRPENALLLRQSSARFLRHDTLAGADVTVMQGPRPAGDTSQSRTRYWIDDEGRLLRFEAYLGDSKGRFAQLSVRADGGEVDGLKDAAVAALEAFG